MSNPTADWERVGDRYYRKIKLYDAVFDQDLELENYIIAGAPYSGAIGEHIHSNTSLLSDCTQHYTETRRKYMRTGAHKRPSQASTFTVVLGNSFAEST